MRRFEAYNYIGEHPEKVLAFANKHFSYQKPKEKGSVDDK
jgi:hypothetical protein